MTAKLPAPGDLERICKGLAALDAVLSEDWESRYYPFNAQWAKGERMASMRNGSGDDWFMVFNPRRRLPEELLARAQAHAGD